MTPTPTPPSTETIATIRRLCVGKAMREVGPYLGGPESLSDYVREVAVLAVSHALKMQAAEFTALTASILRQRTRGTEEKGEK